MLADTVTPTNDAGLQQRLRLAALNQAFNGDLHGIRGADYECQRQSAKAHIKGSFKALLASRVQSINNILKHQSNKQLALVNLKVSSTSTTNDRWDSQTNR